MSNPTYIYIYINRQSPVYYLIRMLTGDRLLKNNTWKCHKHVFIFVPRTMRMSRNLIAVHALSKFKMCLLFSFSDILVDDRHAKLVAESVADLSRCVKNWVTVKQVYATWEIGKMANFCFFYAIAGTKWYKRVVPSLIFRTSFFCSIFFLPKQSTESEIDKNQLTVYVRVLIQAGVQ